MTLNDLQGHSPTASLFRCDILYSYAAVDKITLRYSGMSC